MTDSHSPGDAFPVSAVQAASDVEAPLSGTAGAHRARISRATASLSSLRILGALCLILPLMIFTVVGLYRYQQIREESMVRLDRALRIAHEQALKLLDTNETLLARAIDAVDPAQLMTPGASDVQLHVQLQNLAQNTSQVREIAAYGPDGRAVASSRVYPLPAGMTVAHSVEFEWLRSHDNKALYLSEPQSGNNANNAENTVFNLSRAVQGPGNVFAGFVAVSLRASYLRDFHQELAQEEPGLSVALLRDDGFILSRFPQIAGAPQRLPADSAVMATIHAGQLPASVNTTSSIDGQERMVLVRKLADYPVYITVSTPVVGIRNRWMTEMGWLVAFGLPPLLGLFYAAQVALRRTREMIATSQRLQEETATRRRAEEALLQAQKLEALGRLTGGVAHDFNNALMVISSNLFLLKRKHPEMGGSHIESIGRAVGSATKLTRQLLAFSRRQALVPEYVSLQERLPTLRDLLMPVLGGQVELSLDVRPGTMGVQVDPAELELALINLAINARDAMPASGGIFRIAAHAAGNDVPPLFEGRELVLVEATDNGAGIPAEVLAKVFEPFFTTKPVGQGTGLGLSQIYGLCQRAGGTADIRSTPGQGTAVRLFFPAVDMPPTPKASEPSPTEHRLGLSILMVEDNDEVAAALKPVLEALGCNVRRMDRASAARDWLTSAASLPDVLLTDVVMPGEMDGVALAQYVRDRIPTLKTVLMTGYAEQLESISRMGFVIVPKPCSAEVLVEAFRSVEASHGV